MIPETDIRIAYSQMIWLNLLGFWFGFPFGNPNPSPSFVSDDDDDGMGWDGMIN